jgi:N-acetyl-gamma-glutamyl-phosphate reductase
VLNFLPFRGNFTRGILATSYLTSDLSEEMANSLYDTYYLNHPFVWLSPTNPDIKQVINTNNCFLHLNKIKDKLLIISVIDNLLKGAVGQAVQNMNLMFGLEETSGLNLKPSAF